MCCDTSGAAAVLTPSPVGPRPLRPRHRPTHLVEELRARGDRCRSGKGPQSGVCGRVMFKGLLNGRWNGDGKGLAFYPTCPPRAGRSQECPANGEHHRPLGGDRQLLPPVHGGDRRGSPLFSLGHGSADFGNARPGRHKFVARLLIRGRKRFRLSRDGQSSLHSPPRPPLPQEFPGSHAPQIVGLRPLVHRVSPISRASG